MASTIERPRSPERLPTRRALLAGAALVAPASLLPALAAAASGDNRQIAPDPHPAWFAEWRALVDWYNGPGSGAEEGCPQWHRILELERLAATTPTRTPAGALAQLRFSVAYVDEYGGVGVGINDEAPLRDALATVGRLAGEDLHV